MQQVWAVQLPMFLKLIQEPILIPYSCKLICKVSSDWSRSYQITKPACAGRNPTSWWMWD